MPNSRGNSVTSQKYREILLECLVTLRHASVFVRTREKMRPTGLELYDQLVKDVEVALKSSGPELPPHPQHGAAHGPK